MQTLLYVSAMNRLGIESKEFCLFTKSATLLRFPLRSTDYLYLITTINSQFTFTPVSVFGSKEVRRRRAAAEN